MLLYSGGQVCRNLVDKGVRKRREEEKKNSLISSLVANNKRLECGNYKKYVKAQKYLAKMEG